MVENQEVNAIVEKIHLRIIDILCITIFKEENQNLELDCALQAIAWLFCTTILSMI